MSGGQILDKVPFFFSERQFYPSTKNSVAVEDIQKKQAHHSPVI